jgi:hypothetical protein
MRAARSWKMLSESLKRTPLGTRSMRMCEILSSHLTDSAGCQTRQCCCTIAAGAGRGVAEHKRSIFHAVLLAHQLLHRATAGSIALSKRRATPLLNAAVEDHKGILHALLCLSNLSPSGPLEE